MKDTHQITTENIPEEIEYLIASSYGNGSNKRLMGFISYQTGDYGFIVREGRHGQRYFFTINEKQLAIDKYNSF